MVKGRFIEIIVFRKFEVMSDKMSNKVSDKLNYKEYAFYLAILERLGENVCVDGRGVLASFGEEEIKGRTSRKAGTFFGGKERVWNLITI